jgi:DNA-binding winged helix-turn-helix (wHTH) protein/tetratricopeptide (TPR) repeat protein
MQTLPTNETCLLGVQIDLGHRTIRRDGTEHPLRPKSLEVLAYLIERPGQIIKKDDLVGAVWPGTAISDDSLVQCITELRRALGDDARNPRFIRTISRIGYQLLPGVQTLETAAAPAIQVSEPSHQPRRRWPLVALALTIVIALSSSWTLTSAWHQLDNRSVAVLRFENQSHSQPVDWMQGGLAQVLIAGLARAPGLNVVSRQDPVPAGEAIDVARRARAGFFITGSYFQAGSTLRVQVELRESNRGQLVRIETASAERPELILTQMDLLSAKLLTSLAPPDAASVRGEAALTNNLEALHDYSIAKTLINGHRMPEAIPLLERAIVLDPKFAMAYAELGEAYSMRWFRRELGKPYLEKAFRMTDRLTPREQLYIAGWYAVANSDYREGARRFQEIVARYPEDAFAWDRLSFLLLQLDRREDSLKAAKHGLAVDPESPNLHNSAALALSNLGRVDESIAEAQNYIALSGGEPNAYDTLAQVNFVAGRYKEAERAYVQTVEKKPDFILGLIHLASLHYSLGRYQEALGECERFIQLAASERERGRGYTCLATIHRRLGNSAAAAKDVNLGLRYWPEEASLNAAMLALDRGDAEGAEGRLASYSLDNSAAGSQRPIAIALGELALARGHTEIALGYFRKASKVPVPIGVTDLLEDRAGNAYLSVGRIEEAIYEYQSVLKRNSNEPMVHYHLALAYRKLGRAEEADSEHRKFLAVWKNADPGLAEARAQWNDRGPLFHRVPPR